MRRAAKRDATEDAIVDALLGAGCKVQVLREGMGLPDLLVKTPDGRLHLVECKTPAGALTPAQAKWFAWWGDVPVAQTPAQALSAVGVTP